MKKLFIMSILMLSLGSLSLARGGYGSCHGYHNYGNLSPALQEVNIRIQEKNLEIRKEMLKSNPNWSKIENLNTEIAKERAKLRTENQRNTWNSYR